MTNPETSTRERILHQGLALMSQSGLGGVTLGVLAEQVGMSKSGLFAHFRSKEDVQIELLTHMAEFAQARVIAPSMTAGEGLPRLRARACPEGVRWRPVCSSSTTSRAASGTRFWKWRTNFEAS